MFASQLLRILQTIPSDVKYETCVSSEQDVTMKENPNTTLYYSNFGSKEIYPLNGVRRETDPLVSEENERNESWTKFVDDFSMDNQNGTRNSTEKEFQNGLFYPRSSLNMDADSLSSDTKREEIACFNENELKDSKSPYIAASDLIESDTNFYSDKNVLECDTPELIVCYKDINYHVVKDISVDEGTPVNDKIVIRHSEDEFERPKSRSESYSDKDAAEEVETNSGATDETVSDGSAEDSFIDRALPIQEFGTRSFLRSFINSLDGEEHKIAQLPDQEISSGKIVSEGPTVSIAEAGPKEDVQASSLSYNSKVESKIITFNFNSPAPEIVHITNEKTENVKEQSVDSTNVLDRKNSDSSQVHCSSSEKNTSIEKVQEESQKVEDVLSDDFSAANQAQCVGSNNTINKKHVHDQLPDHKDDNSHDVDSHVSKVNDSVVNQEKYEHGESSFSAAGFITHSGPIACSGSISFRSDGSATSSRSFAFPILQSEWNSSPVRMTKADRRHFRKHKCWRSGLLCCRF